MSPPVHVSREHRIYLALWRKAYQSREGSELVTLTVSSHSTALTVRTGMYKAIKPYRIGESFDEDLAKAAESFVVSVQKEADPTAPHKVVLKPRLSLNELEAEMDKLGLSEADLILPEEAILREGLENLIHPTEPAPVNPFYTRES